MHVSMLRHIEIVLNKKRDFDMNILFLFTNLNTILTTKERKRNLFAIF